MHKKFTDGLDAAIAVNPSLWGFVFTNVDLTPSEVTTLQDYAQQKDCHSFDIFYRERLRIALDSPEDCR